MRLLGTVFNSPRPAQMRFSAGESFRPQRQLSNGIRAAARQSAFLAQVFCEIGVGPREMLSRLSLIAPNLASLPAPHLRSQSSRFGAFTSSMMILPSSPISPLAFGNDSVIVCPGRSQPTCCEPTSQTAAPCHRRRLRADAAVLKFSALPALHRGSNGALSRQSFQLRKRRVRTTPPARERRD